MPTRRRANNTFSVVRPQACFHSAMGLLSFLPSYHAAGSLIVVSLSLVELAEQGHATSDPDRRVIWRRQVNHLNVVRVMPSRQELSCPLARLVGGALVDQLSHLWSNKHARVCTGCASAIVGSCSLEAARVDGAAGPSHEVFWRGGASRGRIGSIGGDRLEVGWLVLIGAICTHDLRHEVHDGQRDVDHLRIRLA